MYMGHTFPLCGEEWEKREEREIEINCLLQVLSELINPSFTQLPGRSQATKERDQVPIRIQDYQPQESILCTQSPRSLGEVELHRDFQ